VAQPPPPKWLVTSVPTVLQSTSLVDLDKYAAIPPTPYPTLPFLHAQSILQEN
jgi:hypothetical protein